jgi:hypothetical protein
MRKMRTVIGVGLCFLALAVGHAFGGSGESNISPVDWNSMMPAVRSVLEKQFPREAEREYPVGIPSPAHIADITGDGITEALVWLGTGGASTSELVLMRWRSIPMGVADQDVRLRFPPEHKAGSELL